jgi:hypothetical protein
LRQHANISQTIIETIFSQRRTVLKGSLTLFNATAKSQGAFSLITLAKALQDIRKQLNNVTELLHLAENKKNLVYLTLIPLKSIDIRNAAFTQLRFWELAVPLTIIVLLAVWILVKFKRRFSRWFRGIIRHFYLRYFRR